MKNDHYSGWLPDYLDGHLTKVQKGEVEAHLKTCGSCRDELREFKVLLMAFKDEKITRPGPELKMRFDEQLEQLALTELKTQFGKTGTSPGNRFPFFPVIRAAAGIALLIGAFMLGRWSPFPSPPTQTVNAQEATSMPEPGVMFALAENRSASKRIQAVHYMDEISAPDEMVLDALIRRMLLDENMNVRLTAVDALEKFKSDKKVADAYLHSLETDRDPAIQIAVIQILVGIREKKAAPLMRKLMEHEDTKPFVKEQIKSLLPIIV